MRATPSRRIILGGDGHYHCSWCGRSLCPTPACPLDLWIHADECWTSLDLADAIRAVNPPNEVTRHEP